MYLLIARKERPPLETVQSSILSPLPSSGLWLWWGDKHLYSRWDIYLHFLGLSKKQMLGQITEDQRQKSQSLAHWRRGRHDLMAVVWFFNLVNNTRSSQPQYRLSLQYLTFYSYGQKSNLHLIFPVKHTDIVFIVFGWLKQRLQLEQRRSTTNTLRIVVERCCLNIIEKFSKASLVLSWQNKTSINESNSCIFASWTRKI